MTIGIDARSLQDTQPSGVGEYTHELLRALFAVDRENTYHLFANATGEVKLPSFDFPNVVLHRFHYPNKLLNLSLRFLGTPKIDRLIPGIDAFFMPNLNFIALGEKIPLIVTTHDLSFELYPSFFTPKQRAWHRLIKPRVLLARAAAIVAVSEHTKNDLVHHYTLPPEKIHVVHPGISPIFLAPPDNARDTEVRNRYNLPPNFILFLSTVEPRKNPDATIEAFRLLKKNPRFADFHLVLAGRRSLRSHIYNSRELENDAIHFLGYIPKEDRPSLYRLARAFVYPSYYEGFGLPPLEAMSQGTPVIASHASSLGEVLGDAALLVDPHNIADLEHALYQILTDEKLATTLSLRGREHAKQFTWEHAAQQTLALLQTIEKNAP